MENKWEFMKKMIDTLGEEDLYKIIDTVKTTCPDDHVNNCINCVENDNGWDFNCADCWCNNLIKKEE